MVLKFRTKGVSTMNMLVKAAGFGLVSAYVRHAASSNENPLRSVQPAYFDVFLMNCKMVSCPT
jgi:hypothetical protein